MRGFWPTICSAALIGSIGCADGSHGGDPDGGVTPITDTGVPDAAQRVDRGLDAGQEGPGPLAPRVENTTCHLPPAPPLGALRVTPAWPNIVMQRPLWFGTAPGQDDLRYVVEQAGRILVFEAENPPAAEVFLQVGVSRNNNEEGLLGLAFHPDYAENGRFFVYFSASNPRRSIIAEMRRDPNNPRRADAASQRILLEVDQPFGNHNGGDLRFGPDGYLYITLGDGGSGGDPYGNGQQPDTLLGSILRIDVDRQDAACGLPYGIPADNPFAAERCQPGREPAGAPEVWAWGLRNV
ncbi:MAG: PQQ-dependent sugar dehydrogenase, partial [Myxococcales bacterium]|nr:PQQ-dependent sugar dehydrogenase [Myxococcales bacterium]